VLLYDKSFEYTNNSVFSIFFNLKKIDPFGNCWKTSKVSYSLYVACINLDKSVKLDLYRTMIRIRLFEQESRRLFKERLMSSRVIGYRGQEAVAAGVSAHLTSNDQIGSSHRPLGHLIAKGSNLGKLFAELCGKRTGFNKGKAGIYHLFDPESGSLGANGIVGGSVPMTSGYALAHQLRGDGGVSISYFGEGASNQGGVQETLNLAACWKLPMVFVCENSSPEVQIMLGHEIDLPQLSIENVSERAPAYGMPGSTHQGWDVEEVYKVAEKAIELARSGGGPTLLEFKVHNIGSTPEETIEPVEEKRQYCPIINYRKKLKTEGVLTDELDEKILEEEKALIAEASDYAVRSLPTEPLEAFTDVFAEDD